MFGFQHRAGKTGKLQCGGDRGHATTRLWVGLCLLCLATLPGGCHRTPDEQRIRNAVAAMQQALEARRPRDFMAYVADDFVGNDGRVDRDALHNLLRLEVLRNDRIGVTLGPLDIDLQGDRAIVHVSATFTGASAGGMLPERGAIYTFTSGWRREDGDWLCYNASWKRKL